jgi:hypothetical protein
VRFVNMTTGLSGSVGFTANGQFVPGSALASGQVAQTCSKLAGGKTSLQTPGATTVVPGSTVTLKAGSANTIALVRNASGGFELIQLPRCS